MRFAVWTLALALLAFLIGFIVSTSKTMSPVFAVMALILALAAGFILIVALSRRLSNDASSED